MPTQYIVKYDGHHWDREERDTWYGIITVDIEDLPIMTHAWAEEWAAHYNTTNRDKNKYECATILHRIKANDVKLDDTKLNEVRKYVKTQKEIKLKNDIENAKKELAKLEKAYKDNL